MTNERLLQISLMALLITSTTMLAISISHYYLIPVAIVTVVGSFLVTDVSRWISIEGLFANTASLAILMLSLNEFYYADSAGKLIAVAKLLVFLQTVLVFQTKTPRLVWQIMVLSLLQVVITTIFSVEFEGGILFFVFFVIGSITLVLQNIFANEYIVQQRNDVSETPLRKLRDGSSFAKRLAVWKYDAKPIPSTSENRSDRVFNWKSLSILPGVICVAGLFTSVLFLTAPRHAQAWFSPITYKVNSTGISQKVELEETGEIKSTSRRIFEATFSQETGTNKPIRLGKAPYFRGIALSNLTYINGKTSWAAAYERINDNTYQAIPPWRGAPVPRMTVLRVTMEKNTNPLIYTTTPVGIAANTSPKLKFCHEISAYTRCRENEKVDFAPFSFELSTPIDNKNMLARSWPYIANMVRYELEKPMSEDPAQERWLTRIDPAKHPRLVEIADRIAEEVRDEGGGRMAYVTALENHFLNPMNYSYTTDFTDIQRNTRIDPNEDFVSNFKAGHCELFASAMTLMLRSQGIPARLVTGFFGGEFNQYEQSYVVRGTHAHAWVEVYLRPDDCERARLKPWEYDEGGAWLTADPTPPRPESESGIGADDAIELARNVWQDYVLGMEADEEMKGQDSFMASMARILRGLTFENISEKLGNSRRSGWLSIAQPLFVVFVILGCLFALLRMLIRSAGYEEEQPTTAVGKLRRFLADAIGLISTDLREWVIGQDPETAFYRRLTDILERHNFVRNLDQTHREFASSVSEELNDHDSSSMIGGILEECTEAFNRVRFGKKELGPDEQTRLANQLDELNRLLQA